MQLLKAASIWAATENLQVNKGRASRSRIHVRTCNLLVFLKYRVWVTRLIGPMQWAPIIILNQLASFRRPAHRP
jgi:hypothetical protein